MKYTQKRHPGLEIALVVLLTGALSACSSQPKRVDNDDRAVHENRVAHENRTAAAVDNRDRDEGASFVTELNFARGSAQLTQSAREKLDALVSKAKNNGEVDDIKVMAWADQSLPANPKKDLPSSQRSLAEKRSDQIKDYLRETSSLDDIDTFNMAKKPSKLSELFNTENARVKEDLAQAGVSESAIASKTGKALVMVILKKNDRH